MRLLLTYILISSLITPAVAQSTNLTQTGNVVGGAIQASGNFKKICRCSCDTGEYEPFSLLFFDDKCTDFNFDDPTISDPVQCQALNGIKSEGHRSFKGGLCDSEKKTSCSLIGCSIVAVPIQP
jgi:hypothetical protein